MTAGIGVFNKMAAVLAADSAGTIGNGRKVYNNANKIFNLNKHEKVGILVYNYSSWFGIPLELIVKLYKDNEARYFNTLIEYVEDFKSFLNDKIVDLVDKPKLEEYSESIFYYLTNNLTDILRNQLQLLDINTKKDLKNKTLILNSILDEIITDLNEDIEETKVLHTDFELFKSKCETKINSLIRGFCSSENLEFSKALEGKIFQAYYLSSITPFNEDDYFVGLVFTGYGENEIFPSIYEIRFSGYVADEFKFYTYGSSEIDHENSSCIVPFAQREMVETFMEGINPIIHNKLFELIMEKFDKIETELNIKLPKKKIENIFLENFKELINEFEDIKQEHMVEPVLDTISLLRKEDLIEVAESLVGITSLKRKTTLEVETVGGPVDIALITKAEGFIWVKRKEKLNGF